MAIEIERKVPRRQWRLATELLTNGANTRRLVATTDDRKVRVRIYGERATIAIKANEERGDFFTRGKEARDAFACFNGSRTAGCA